MKSLLRYNILQASTKKVNVQCSNFARQHIDGNILVGVIKTGHTKQLKICSRQQCHLAVSPLYGTFAI